MSKKIKLFHKDVEVKVLLELTAVYAILTLLFVGMLYLEPTITGFATADGIGNETTINDTLTESVETINETIVNETPEEIKTIKLKKPEPNQPPVWKSDVDEFTLKGKTVIDLNNYFSDKNNDVISYAVTTPERISVEIENNIVTITPIIGNFTTSITFTASDGEKSTQKEVTLIVPERIVIINLEYRSGTAYDADDDGIERTTGVIDFTVEKTKFNWDVNEENLCTLWETYSVESGESTLICYGNDRCCQFVDLLATKPTWNEPFFSAYGTYGAGFNNIISSQVLHVDYDLDIDDPFAEIYYSNWADSSASYYFEYIEFDNICVDTCALTGFNQSSYTLIFEIEDAILELDTLTYTIIETISKVLVDLEVEDNKGIESGSYKLYKDYVLIIDKEVEPDYYDIEVIPKQKFIEKLLIYNVNIIEPLIGIIGVDNVSRKQIIRNVEVKKQYAIDASDLDFETATLTAVAEANSLFKCKQWDYDTEVCFGSWEKIKDLVPGQEYELTITPDDPGFVEGNSLLENNAPITDIIVFSDGSKEKTIEVVS